MVTGVGAPDSDVNCGPNAFPTGARHGARSERLVLLGNLEESFPILGS